MSVISVQRSSGTCRHALSTLQLYILKFISICAVALLLLYYFTGQVNSLQKRLTTDGTTKTIAPPGDVRSSSAPQTPPSLQSVHLSEFSYVHWPAPCRQGEPQPLLLGAVFSTPSSVTKRRLLRRLYMSLTEYREFRFRWVFILGSVPNATLQSVIDKEAAEFGDVVQLSFLDTYANLTLKTLTAIDWTTAACRSAQFYFKTDEDCMINPFRLVESLMSLNLSVSRNLYAGFVPDDLSPNRDIGPLKWRLNYKEYPLVKFAAYSTGAGYLLSRLALRKVLSGCDTIFPLRIEDVYVGLCAKRAGLTLIRHTPFFLAVDDGRFSNWCKVRRNVVIHGVPPDDMIRLWRHMTAASGLDKKCGENE